MSAIMQRFYKDKTLGTKALKLAKPTEYKAKRLRLKTWHNDVAILFRTHADKDIIPSTRCVR